VNDHPLALENEFGLGLLQESIQGKTEDGGMEWVRPRLDLGLAPVKKDLGSDY
jgi:hypothetical protein